MKNIYFIGGTMGVGIARSCFVGNLLCLKKSLYSTSAVSLRNWICEGWDFVCNEGEWSSLPVRPEQGKRQPLQWLRKSLTWKSRFISIPMIFIIIFVREQFLRIYRNRKTKI